VAPSLRVRRLLEITGLDDVMTIVDGDDIDGSRGATA
jgi:anti-anti-sigma regulatory factor